MTTHKALAVLGLLALAAISATNATAEEFKTKADEFKIIIDLSGKVNDVEFTAKGEGKGDPSQGNPVANLTYSAIPKDADALGIFLGVINMFSLTLSKEVDFAKNFLTLTDGNFEFDRMVEGKDISISGKGSVKQLSPKEILITAQIDGTISLGRVTTVEPWEGVQVPNGKGKVLETMVIRIKVEGQKEPVHLYVVTRYTLAKQVELPSIQIRHIELDSSVEGKTLRASFKATISPPR